MAKWRTRLAIIWIILVMVLYIPTNGLTSLINRANASVTLSGLGDLQWGHVGVFLRELPVALLGVTVITLAFVLAGAGVLRLFTRRVDDPLVGVVTSLLLGQWVLSLGLYGVALAGVFRPLPVIGVLGGGALVGALAHRQGLRQMIGGLGASLRELVPAENPWRLLFGLGAVLFLLSGITAWAQMSNDGATAYFLAARRMALEGELRIVSEYVFHITSLHTELQYAAGTLLFSHRAGRLVSWVYLLLTVLMAFPLGRAFGLDKRETTVFAFMVGSSTALLDLAGDGKIDLTGIALGMAALVWLLKALEHDEQRLYWLTGLLLGITVIDKPTYIPFMAVLTLTALVWRFQPGWGKLFARGVVLACAGLVPVVFYMVGKWAVTGEPFAPAFYFDAPLQPTDVQFSETWTSDPQTIRIVRLFFPLVYTFLPTHFSLGTLTPLWLAFLPFTLSAKRFKSFPALYRWLVIAASSVFLGWLWLSFAVEELRYFYVVWVLLFVLSARGIVHAYQRVQSREITRLVLIATSLLLIVRVIGLTAGMTDVATGDTAARCRTLIGCDNNQYLNATAAEGERVVQTHEFGHYLRDDLIACLPTAAEYHMLTRASFDGTFWQTAYDMGFSYLNYKEVYSFRTWQFIMPGENPVPDGLRVAVIGESSELEGTLYAITAEPGYPPPSRSCKP